MSFRTYGLFGLTAISSVAGFVFNLLTGNPDMALLCFVGVGGAQRSVGCSSPGDARSGRVSPLD
jgi:hypothetical protein